MDEFLSRFAIGGTAGTPPLTEIPCTRVALQRNVIQSYARSDPRRNLCGASPIFSAYSAGWDFELGQDAASIETVISALCDPGTNGIGNRGAVTEMLAHTAMEDGSAWRLGSGVLTDFTFSAAPGSVVNCQTQWMFGRLTAAAFPATVQADGYRKASNLTTTAVIGARTMKALSVSLAFAREVRPAGFSLDGYSTAFAGQINFDLTGRMTVRLSSADATTALRERFVDSITVTAAAGGHTVTIFIPSATFQVTSRRIVSLEILQYDLDFLGMKTPAAPLATITSTGGTPAV